MKIQPTQEDILKENEILRQKLLEAEETLLAIRSGQVDAIVVSGVKGDQVFTLKGADYSYRVLIETMNEGAALLNAQGIVMYCNDRLREFLDTKQSKIIGHSLEQFVFPKDKVIYNSLFSNGLIKPTRGEVRWRCKNGKVISLQLSSNPFNLDYKGVCFIFTNISYQKKVEEKLSRMKEQLEKIVIRRTQELQSTNQELQKEIVERKLAEHQQKVYIHRLELLSTTAENLLRATQPERLIDSLCLKAMPLIDCQVFFNFMVDETNERLHLNAYSGIPKKEAKRIEWLDYGVAICGCVARDGKRIISQHIQTIQDPRIKLVKSYGIKAYACHPILDEKGGVLGTLSFGTRNRDTFSNEDLLLMKAIADQYAVALIRMRSAQQLQQSEEKYRRIVENTTNTIMVTQPDGIISFVSPSCKNVLGYEAEEIIGSNHLIVHPEDNEKVQKILDEALYGKKGSNLEYRIITKRGEIKWISHSWSPVFQQKKFQYIVSVIEDITKRKIIEKNIVTLNEDLQRRSIELSSANNELESFSYSVSHDLKAPLRSIDGFSQALMEDYKDKLDEKGIDFLIRVRKSTQRMGQLIDDMLKLSRLSRTDLKYEHINFSVIANDLIAKLQSLDPKRKKQIIIQQNVVTKGDKTLLETMLENLLGNAWKFTNKAENPTIEFGTTKKGDETVFFVRDNGAGFDMAYADKLFLPFQRLHSIDEYTGTGIGLAIVSRIVHRHGGRVWAEGEVEKGATFFFTLEKKGGR